MRITARKAAIIMALAAHAGLATEVASVVEHEETGKKTVTEEAWNVHGQATLVPQGHGGFASPYHSAETSLLPTGELNTSFTATLYAGARAWKGAEIYLNPEIGAGTGISNSHGIAGFTNAEIYRVGDDAKPKPYLSRVFLRQTIGLGGPQENIEAGPNQIATRMDVSRVTFTLGKFSLNDMFDNNAYAHDPRTQFLNWALMDNGAWDYAADTRGYTWGVVVELNQKDWAVRLGSVMIPISANQMDLEYNLGKARGDNAELEYRYELFRRPGRVRLLGFVNQARMGKYRRAIAEAAASGTVPKIETTRDFTTKYGLGLNFQQELSDDVGAFLRLGWNDGATETWAFTEIDRALSLGVNVKGRFWGRPADTVGLAYVLNGLSDAHADYLRAGGSGFMVGDGKVSYALEQIVEVFYALKPLDALALSLDLQEVFNPAYNRDRGPVTVVSGRIHAEL